MQYLLIAVLVLVMSFWLRIVYLSRVVYQRRISIPQTVLLVMAQLLVRWQWRARLPEHFPIPLGQGAVIVCNHRSSVDPFFVQACADRPIHWMVAKEYCEHPAFRWFLRTCGVIPVSRGGIDTAATKSAIRIVRNGGIVGMFPEGRINMSDAFMLPVRPGAIMVAQKASVPIYPCYIEGSPYRKAAWSPLLMRAKATLRFGEPLPPPDREELAAESILLVARAIARVAGREDFEPTLAGRRWKPTEEEFAP